MFKMNYLCKAQRCVPCVREGVITAVSIYR